MVHTVTVIWLPCSSSHSVKEALYAHASCIFNLEKTYCFTLK